MTGARTFSLWETRGAELEQMLRVLVGELAPHEPGTLADLVQRTLDGSYDPRQHVGGCDDA